MNNTTKKGAFTLIELLIVVAIIGVLAGIVVISISGSTEDASKAAKKSNLRVIGTVYAQAQGLKVNGGAVDLSKFCGGEMGTAEDVNVLESQVISVMGAVFGTVGDPKNDVNTKVGGSSSDATTYTNEPLSGTNLSEAGCASSASGWVVWADTTTGKYWCIDSTGFAGEQEDEVIAGGKILAGEVTCNGISN